MSRQQLCEPCQELFREGTRCDSHFEHHSDAASFEKALQLPCCLCTLVWGNLTKKSGILPSKTSWVLSDYAWKQKRNERTVFFRMSDMPNEYQRLIAFIPWQSLYG
jgi:hypothetical protein